MNENRSSELEPYHKEVVRRLSEVLGDRLTLDECIALMSTIHLHSFRFADGFVLNDESDINREIWLADASLIAAALYEAGDKDWRWFKAEYPAHDKESQAFEALCTNMLSRLERSAARIE